MYGTLISGKSAASTLISEIEVVLYSQLSFLPYNGTLNLTKIYDFSLKQPIIINDIVNILDNCDGIELYPCSIGGIKSALIRPLAKNYPASKFEFIAPVSLRDLFSLSNGDSIRISSPNNLWTNELKANVDYIDSFDGVVFDLDGTLVNLPVDWKTVRGAIKELFGPFIDPFSINRDRNDHSILYELAHKHGIHTELLELLSFHETEGAKKAFPLPLLNGISNLECPIGICTKNSQAAVDEISDRFDLNFNSSITRESTLEDKPHPRPLQKCMEELHISPGNTLFIGNEKTDAETALRAGTNFLRVSQLV